MSERNTAIDFLRGFAIIIMILIHVTAYYLHDPLANFIWDYTHFAVPLFIFCSAYVYFERKKDIPLSVSYFYKRVKRLILPYYLYHVLFFGLVYFFTQQIPPVQSIINYVTLKGSSDHYLSWLVVLFLYLIILMPFIRFISNKKLLLILFSGISIASSIYLLFIVPDMSFRYTMWLPWSFILLITWFFIEVKNKYKFILLTIIISVILFIITRYIILSQDNSLILIRNKYPPNLYYLSYGLTWIFGLYLLHKVSRMKHTILQSFFNFVSKHSYSLFFIHYLWLYIIWDGLKYRELHWSIFYVSLTIISLVTQVVFNYLMKLIYARY